MSPKETVHQFVELFNAQDINKLAELYQLLNKTLGDSFTFQGQETIITDII